jgi:hypothetical protein
MKYIIAAVAFTLLSSAADANISVKEYREFRDNKNSRAYTQAWVEIERYLLGAGSAFQNVNVWLRGERRPAYYCPPPQLDMNVQNLESIIDARLQRMTDPKYDPIELAQILMYGLMETFPCPK